MTESIKITEEACLSIGGHCWPDTHTTYYSTLLPGVPGESRICKHCGKKQFLKNDGEWRDA